MVDRLWPLILTGWPTKLDDLCAPADIPRATLYYYVPGVPAFVAWVVDEQLRRSLEVARDAALGTRSPGEALAAATVQLLRLWRAAPHIAARLLDHGGTDGVAWDELHALTTRLLRAAGAGRDAPARATATLGALAALAATGAPVKAATAAVQSLAWP